MKNIKGSFIFEGNEYSLETLEDFSKELFLEDLAPNRISKLLLTQIYNLFKSGGNNIAKIMHEIKILEGRHINSGTKPATEYTGKILAGLWHKHYLEDDIGSLLINIAKPHVKTNKYTKNDIDKILNDLADEISDNIKEGDDLTKEIDKFVYEEYKKSKAKSKLTGEWIIFAKNEGKNYYLCIGKHETGDDVIRSQIDSVCALEFPFLKNILS